MSRIGKLPLAIPKGVTVSVQDGKVSVEGPKGKATQAVSPMVGVRAEGGSVVVTRTDDSKQSKALHGLYRNLVKNMITGVSEGFSKILVINGVGYRAELKGKSLMLSLGFSNPIEYPVPPGIAIEVEANTRIVVRGSDRARVGQVASEIRSFRPTEPYKGKGIRYDNEYVRRKVGKSGIK